MAGAAPGGGLAGHGPFGCGRGRGCTAASRSSLGAFLVRKSSAPLRIACTLVGMSPWPVRKTIGRGLPESRNACCNSIPFISGIIRSVITQPVMSGCSSARNSAAELWMTTGSRRPSAFAKSSAGARGRRRSRTRRPVTGATEGSFPAPPRPPPGGSPWEPYLNATSNANLPNPTPPGSPRKAERGRHPRRGPVSSASRCGRTPSASPC